MSRWLPFALPAVFALGACTSAPVPNDSGPASGPAVTSPAPQPSAESPAGASGAPLASSSNSAAVAASAPHVGPLATFHDALRALERGERKQHVRIAWLGDSHAQADFWTGHLRNGLQGRFGNAGPGFVHLGFKAYRHHGLRIEVNGSWRMRPKQPSTIEPWGDGAFGRGGILHAGFAGQRWAQIELTEERLAKRKLRWDICYKHGLPHDEFRLELGAAPRETIKVGSDTDVGKLRHLERDATGLARLRVSIVNGRPDFCGVAIETDPTDHPGVVLDNFGINGARYGTALAWGEQPWAEEMKRRPPDLFVFEYGGNEAGDGQITPAKYKQQALELIARARRIRGDASCLVIGPADRADAEDKIPPIVGAMRAAASEARCMFWDTYQIMGGKGSLRKWRDDERAAEDGVHLKPKGYTELGALLLADVLADYRP